MYDKAIFNYTRFFQSTLWHINLKHKQLKLNKNFNMIEHHRERLKTKYSYIVGQKVL